MQDLRISETLRFLLVISDLQSDHYIRECPQKDTTEKPVNAQGKPLPPPTYLCRACGKTGDHYARDCDVVIERQQGRQKQLGPAECWYQANSLDFVDIQAGSA